MVLTNHIIRDVIGGVFSHHPWGGEGKNSIVKLIKYIQGIRLIKSDQRIELIKTNQRVGLI